MHVLRQDDNELFIKILNDCCKYSKAINAKASHPTEVLLMAIIVLYQARTIRLSPIILYIFENGNLSSFVETGNAMFKSRYLLLLDLD